MKVTNIEISNNRGQSMMIELTGEKYERVSKSNAVFLVHFLDENWFFMTNSIIMNNTGVCVLAKIYGYWATCQKLIDATPQLLDMIGLEAYEVTDKDKLAELAEKARWC